MCRKSRLHGCCVVFFALGLIVGHCIESWFLCTFGGLALVILGICIMRQK